MTGYVVHYSSNGVTNSISGLPSTSTSHDITGLTNGGTYSISVEAISEHLYGESENETITLCEFPLNNTYKIYKLNKYPGLCHWHSQWYIIGGREK